MPALSTAPYVVWAVEILVRDSRGRPRRWEIWDVHVEHAEARSQAKTMNSNPHLRRGEKLARVRACVPRVGEEPGK